LIGVFDSGFGGLTKLSAFIDELPEYDYIYLGDNARAPYGDHSKGIITEYTRQGVRFLFDKGANLVILACNTASSNALRTLQEEEIRGPQVKDRNILGVIFPIAEEVARLKAKRIGLIGTRATVESGVYREEISKGLKDFELTQKACPLLVPLIEQGWVNRPETMEILESYLEEVKAANPEILVPGCTHYSILQDEIEEIMGPEVKVLETGKIVARSLRDYLGRHPEIESRLGKNGRRKFYCTDSPEEFKKIGETFFGHGIEQVELAKLG